MAFFTYKRLLFAAVAVSMVAMLPARESPNAFTSATSVTLNPKTLATLKSIETVLGQISSNNKVLGTLFSPVLNLCNVCSSGSLPGLISLLQLIVSAVLSLVTALLSPFLKNHIGTVDQTLLQTLLGLITKLLSAILLEVSLLVQGLLAIIVGLLCFLLNVL